MKILLLVPEYPPYHIGGGGIVYENLALNLTKSGHNVVVVWGYYPSTSFFDRVECYEKDKIRFYKIPEFPVLFSKPFLRTAMPPAINGLFAIKNIVKKEKPDIVHLHGYGILFIVISSFVCRCLGQPYVFTIHGYPKTPEKNSFFRLFWKFYERMFLRQMLKNSQRITCVSGWLAKDVRLQSFQEKVDVIYNGIDAEKFRTIKKGSNQDFISNKFSLPKNGLFLCSLGRISEMKGFQLVVTALPELLNRYPNCYYIIIGEDDGYKKNLQKLANESGIEDRVIFAGFVDEVTKLKSIQECDVFIVPSLWEPFGLTALEGLAMEKIVVTTGNGGLKEFLSNSKNVIFFDHRSIESLKQSIGLVLDGKKKFRDEDYIQEFAWNQVIKDYLNFYERALE